jgi:hypothetical protein
MSLLTIILLLSVTLIAINPSIVIALNASNNEPSNNTDFGGLSVESTDIAGANKTDLINGTNNNNNNDTDFGGLSARSVNITK